MHYTFKWMNQKEAETISKWQYPGRYSFYNPESDLEDLAELLDPEMRGYHYYSAYHDNELVGYLTFHYDREKRYTVIGLGLAPQYTGLGLGSQFVTEGLDYGRHLFPGTEEYRLSVAAFNNRAIKIYQRNGFCTTGESMVETNGGVYRFVHMKKSFGTDKTWIEL